VGNGQGKNRGTVKDQKEICVCRLNNHLGSISGGVEDKEKTLGFWV
jgi:hypothetical protein